MLDKRTTASRDGFSAQCDPLLQDVCLWPVTSDATDSMSQVAERQHHQDPGGGGGEESHHHVHHRPSPDGDPLLGLPNFTGFDPYTGPGSGSSGSGGGLLADTDGVFSEGLPSRLLERPLVDGADSSGGTYRPWESTERSIASSIANGTDQFHFSGYQFSTPSSGGGGGSPLPSFSTFQSSYPGLQAPMTARELENFTGDDRLLVYSNNGSTGPPTPLSSSTVVSTPTPPAFTNGSSIAVVADIKPPLSDLKAFNHGIEMPTSSPAPHVGADQGGPQGASVLTPLQPPNGGQLKRAGQIKRPFEALTPDSIKREHPDSSPRLESTGVHQVSAVTSSDLLEVSKQHHQHQQSQHTVNNNGFHHHHHHHHQQQQQQQQQQHQQHHQQHQTPQHVHPHHHPHPHQQQQHLLLRQQQQHQEDVPSSAGGDKPTKKKRKRCGECSGCQTKENCGGCAPCKNERSHQICKMRRCDKLVEKKAPRERGKNASSGPTTANRQVAPSNQSFGAASPSANNNTPTTVNNGPMLPADPRPGSYPSSAAVWPSVGQNANPQWPAAAQFFDPRPAASLHYAHAQTAPAAAFYATPTAATNISTIDTGAHFASAAVDPFAHAPTAASVQFGAANGFHAGPSYLVSNGGEKGAHVLIPVSNGDLLAAKMAVTPQGVMTGLGRPPGGLMVSTTITPLTHHAQLTQSLNSQPGHPLYSPRPNSHSSNGCDDVSSVRCPGDSGAPPTAATTSPGYTCSNMNQHASLQDRLKQKIYERQQQQQQHSPRFNKHLLHMSDSGGYAANGGVFHHSTAAVETALNGGGGGCYTAADSQVGSSVSSDRVTSSSGSLEMHRLLPPQQKLHQEHFLVVRAADVSVMTPHGATAAFVCPPSLSQDCPLDSVPDIYVLLTYFVLVRREVESGRKCRQIGITALSAALNVWSFFGLSVMHFSSIQVLL